MSCLVTDCDRDAHTRGLCQKHYKQEHAHPGTHPTTWYGSSTAETRERKRLIALYKPSYRGSDLARHFGVSPQYIDQIKATPELVDDSLPPIMPGAPLPKHLLDIEIDHFYYYGGLTITKVAEKFGIDSHTVLKSLGLIADPDAEEEDEFGSDEWLDYDFND